MGEFARTLQTAIRDGLAANASAFEWREEDDVGGTPVDVVGLRAGAGASDVLVAVELEVRRADPANNTVKLLRNLEDGVLDRFDRVVVCQVFSAYYDLVDGGVSTKRENATFVGRLAADAHERVTYHAVDLCVNPPKRGGDPPVDWAVGVDDAVAAVERALAGRFGDEIDGTHEPGVDGEDDAR